MTSSPGRVCLRVLPWLILGLLLGSCSGLAFPGRSPSPEALPTSAPTNTLPPAVTAAPLDTPVSVGPYRLMLWVPPQFDPNSGSPAGELLKQRLQDFTRRMPGVQIDVRVKAETGPGGLYDSLATASAAAPNARPDLIALPQDTLQASALKGLLQPFDGLTIAMSDPDWYEYARQLADLQTIQFGMPFAGDALLLAHRPSLVETPPSDWATVLNSKNPLVFSAADPQALFTLSQYQAAGGYTSDDQGRPALDAEILTGVLDFFAQANQSGALPGWLTELQDPAQAWQAFREGRADQAVVWATQYLPAVSEVPADLGGGEVPADLGQGVDLAAAPLPTPAGEPLTLATGWVWALGNTHSPHQELATRLAEFLSESSFLAKWTQAAGYLPPRPSALQAWTNPPAPEGFTWQAQLQPILESARLYPPIEVLSNLGPLLQQATLQVLSGQADPADAAHSAVESLSRP
jgi:multiple sugar transport system substrate-binding protein